MRVKGEKGANTGDSAFGSSQQKSDTQTNSANVVSFESKSNKKKAELRNILYDRIRARAQHIG